jgi:hypothetical protein
MEVFEPQIVIANAEVLFYLLLQWSGYQYVSNISMLQWNCLKHTEKDILTISLLVATNIVMNVI